MLALALALLAACDKATPVAPGGSVLSVSANPSRISLSGQSTITVLGRKPDGNPFNRGTEIRLSTNLGTIDNLVTVDEGGVATATLRADGRQGPATVTATSGDGTVTATATVQIGETGESKPTLLLTVSPNNIPVLGSAVVTVIGRNPDGSPVAGGQTVILTSTLGTLNPARPQTKNDGTATSTLAAGSQAGSATITAIMGASDAATTTLTIRDAATAISLQANPASVPRADSTVTLSAFVANAQGQPLQGAPVTFQADRGTLQTNGVVFTQTNGVATNTLNLRTADLPSGVNSLDVTATTPREGGTLLEDTVTITVR